MPFPLSIERILLCFSPVRCEDVMPFFFTVSREDIVLIPLRLLDLWVLSITIWNFGYLVTG